MFAKIVPFGSEAYGCADSIDAKVNQREDNLWTVGDESIGEHHFSVK